jgi:REP element-mobilizing transposase RayT
MAYKIENQSEIHFLTMTVVGWADIFTRQIYRDLLLDSMNYCVAQKGLIVYGYVIMTNHIHCIWQAKNGNLSDLIRDFKKYTALNIIKYIESNNESRKDWLKLIFEYHAKYNDNNSSNQVWQSGSHPIELSSPKFFRQKLDYIHLNPVRAGWVNKPEDYIYSSASNYLNNSGIMDVTLLDIPLSDVGYINF